MCVQAERACASVAHHSKGDEPCSIRQQFEALQYEFPRKDMSVKVHAQIKSDIEESWPTTQPHKTIQLINNQSQWISDTQEEKGSTMEVTTAQRLTANNI